MDKCRLTSSFLLPYKLAIVQKLHYCPAVDPSEAQVLNLNESM